MRRLRHPLAVAAPGLVALVLAVVAVARTGDTAPAPAPAPAPPAPATAARADAPLTLPELYARIDGAVGRVDARRDPSQPRFGNGRHDAIGAGFLVDRAGHVVTNAHVVDRARSATVRFGRSERRIPARIVGHDDATDLAVLRVDPARLRGERPLAIARPDSIEVGEPVLAVGTPYRLQGSAAAGIVSATGREIRGLNGDRFRDGVQTDAAINPGNSGGPLVDAAGAVVGVNAQGRAPGISFAIGAATVRRVVPRLIRAG